MIPPKEDFFSHLIKKIFKIPPKVQYYAAMYSAQYIRPGLTLACLINIQMVLAVIGMTF